MIIKSLSMNNIAFIFNTKEDFNEFSARVKKAKIEQKDATSVYIIINSALITSLDLPGKIQSFIKNELSVAPIIFEFNEKLPLDAKQQFNYTYPELNGSFAWYFHPGYKFNKEEAIMNDKTNVDPINKGILEEITDDRLEQVLEYLKHFTETKEKKIKMRKRLIDAGVI